MSTPHLQHCLQHMGQDTASAVPLPVPRVMHTPVPLKHRGREQARERERPRQQAPEGTQRNPELSQQIPERRQRNHLMLRSYDNLGGQCISKIAVCAHEASTA